MILHVKFALYALLSSAMAAYMVYDALLERPNYYSAGMKMCRGPHLMAIGNWLLVMAITVGKLLQVLLFGELRIIEMEHIYERSWFMITNMLMTVAVHRKENTLLLGVLASGLLFMKCFHWILEDRLEMLIQQKRTLRSTVFNRNIAVLVLFIYLDNKIVRSCINRSFIHSADVFLIFGLDFFVVYLNILDSTWNFALNLIELIYLNRNPEEDAWESKIWLSKIGSFILNLIKGVSVLFLFVGLIYAHRLPVNFARDMYTSIARLVKQFKDILYLVKAARNLKNNVLNASESDLERDDICIICRDDMEIIADKNHRMAPKKLHCGHVLHYGCLKSWLGRSHVCPTCRRNVFEDRPKQKEKTTINIPRNAFIPPDWTVLPATRAGSNSYTIQVNSQTVAQLRTRTQIE
ncbi:hypothetical protein OGAPHI_001866 [Ogataea philodendri]|uniref:RING-type E3 ubiquitin transferase n=1 Tax=Ogataea philodendri TaxID=1378263 RepID=A0A9P8PB50_9ASCO|nr:uncharacterized protein OGAPHI_001866 [Ogataea philodendri]KAH3668112.1 hypothetical protein OGAPHI_001866 [Ogataea philodendri]